MAEILARATELAVPTERLRTICTSLGKTDERPAARPAVSQLGQARAVESLQFGIELECEGYNVFVLGPPGSRRHSLATELAEARAIEKDAPNDWCYANNFADPERPRALRLPAGRGTEFRDDMHALIQDIRIAIPAIFEEDDYRNQLKAIEAELQQEIKEQWEDLRRKAAKEDIAVLQTPSGYVLTPVIDDKVMTFQILVDGQAEFVMEALLFNATPGDLAQDVHGRNRRRAEQISASAHHPDWHETVCEQSGHGSDSAHPPSQ